MKKIGFIGMGNMGFAMLNGVLKHFAPEELLYTDVNRKRMEEVREQTQVDYVPTNQELASQVQYLILAVKPQFLDEVLRDIQDIVTPSQVVISIAAGVSVEYLKKGLHSEDRIVRAMPNTPALLGEGMTGVCYDKEELTPEEVEVVEEVFCSVGKMEKVEESMLAAVTCASGSSPAYVYLFIEALADSVVKYGMPRAQAYEFVAQTVLGSAKMVLESKEHPGVLKDRVCSPGGTTICGVGALEEYGLRNALFKATDACYEKSTHMK